jgi:hypothetical protein
MLAPVGIRRQTFLVMQFEVLFSPLASNKVGSITTRYWMAYNIHVEKSSYRS